MAITHAAQTESVTFLLDESGICFAVVATPSARPEAFARARESAERCIGAQYVASVDVTAVGGLIAMPRAGTPLVFATVDREGRVALVRTGPLERFATIDGSTRVAPDTSRSGAMPSAVPETGSAGSAGREDGAVSTARASIDEASEPAWGSRDTDVVTLRPSLVPSLVPPTLAWGTPRPTDVAIADVDDESERDTLDLVESVPFSLRRRVSEVVPRGTADDDEAPATERVQERAV